MDELIWSVEPHDEPAARMRLLELVPGLLKALRDGLTSSAFDPFATGEFFSQLEALHVQAFQRELQSIDPAAAHDEPPMVAVLEEIVLEGTEMTLADEEFTLRCKLTAIIESTGKYIFVNRTGMKVLERTRTQLALEFRDGHVRVLDDTLLFDRALDSVVSNLRKLKA